MFIITLIVLNVKLINNKTNKKENILNLNLTFICFN